jgi:hypothetical protein
MKNFKNFDKYVIRTVDVSNNSLPFSYFDKSGGLFYENNNYQIWFNIDDAKNIFIYFYVIGNKKFENIEDLLTYTFSDLLFSESIFDKLIKDFKDIIFEYSDIINNKEDRVNKMFKILKSKKFNL